MSGFKGIMKDGWHPKGRDGKKESWRNDFKGVNQVAGWMGKGRDPRDEERENHVSRPLESLKDPSSFGPPPKHIKYHGAAALPNETTPDRSGMGAPLSESQINNQYSQKQLEEEEARRQAEEAEEAARRPPVPYRANRTGIDTSTLLPPPRRVGAATETRPPAPSPRPKTGAPPSVPPRVPPRTNTSTPASHTPSPPPAYSPSPQASEQIQDSYINQAATSRLSQAGVSVPGLGIGSRPSNPTSPSTGYNQAPVNELQSRFAQMRTNSESTPSAPRPPARQPTSPAASGTNVANAKSAFSDFRAKHSDQIDSGKQKLSGLNQKYGITERINSALDGKSASSEQAPPIPPHPNLSRTTTSSTDTVSLAQRKAPPPPPPQKKAGLRSAPVSTGSPAPPPLPLGTKPR
ncbi:uncharacterized protein BDV17DRAFT_249581 [Aspergillus undulatus]|uniref:uncharacterized protein n=1 Tax=Aspergillus undulatus TaxID=1810928 RepID=UPI003CCCCFF7